MPRRKFLLRTLQIRSSIQKSSQQPGLCQGSGNPLLCTSVSIAFAHEESLWCLQNAHSGTQRQAAASKRKRSFKAGWRFSLADRGDRYGEKLGHYSLDIQMIRWSDGWLQPHEAVRPKGWGGGRGGKYWRIFINDPLLTVRRQLAAEGTRKLALTLFSISSPYGRYWHSFNGFSPSPPSL